MHIVVGGFNHRPCHLIEDSRAAQYGVCSPAVDYSPNAETAKSRYRRVGHGAGAWAHGASLLSSLEMRVKYSR